MIKYYLVGGAVRDHLLHRPIHDRDWLVVGATPEEMRDKRFEQVGQAFPVFLHPKTKEEYALARKEQKQGSGYTGFVCDFAPDITLEEDLYRRDLTINAMAQDEVGELIDPYNGYTDLKNRCLRHVSDAFVEDPLRVLRTARFLAQLSNLGFTIADETMELMTQISQSGELKTLSVERIWMEWYKALLSPHPECFIETLHQCKALEQLIPEIDNLFGVPQPEKWHPEIDVGIHILLVTKKIAQLTDNPKFRFVAQLHDLGKAQTDPLKWPSHSNHEILGLDLVDSLCIRLKVPKEYHQDARLFCRYHTHIHKILELRSKTILEMFNRLDVWRKPERVELIKLCATADYCGRLGFETRDYPQSELFSKLYLFALEVDIKEIIAAGFRGEAIKVELDRQRLQKIDLLKERLKLEF